MDVKVRAAENGGIDALLSLILDESKRTYEGLRALQRLYMVDNEGIRLIFTTCGGQAALSKVFKRGNKKNRELARYDQMTRLVFLLCVSAWPR